MEHHDSQSPILSVILVAYTFLVSHIEPNTLSGAEFVFVESTKWLAAACAIIVSLPGAIINLKAAWGWCKKLFKRLK